MEMGLFQVPRPLEGIPVPPMTGAGGANEVRMMTSSLTVLVVVAGECVWVPLNALFELLDETAMLDWIRFSI